MAWRFYVHHLLQLYYHDQTTFGPTFLTTFPFDGRIDDMCYVMDCLRRYGVDVSLANSVQYRDIVCGIMHLRNRHQYFFQ